MEFTGILTQALGNFWCIRGYATLGDLAKASKPDESFQRSLIATHRHEIINFLSNRRFLFFPEVILGANLSVGADEQTTLDDQLRPLLDGKSKSLALAGITIASKRMSAKSAKDVRARDDYHFVQLRIDDKAIAAATTSFSRIDGNHRISAALLGDHRDFSEIVCPFCIILFRNTDEAHLYSRAIFHNINAKSIPLRLEQNLRLILDYPHLFSDDDLKTSPSFGWAYYFARKVSPNSADVFQWLPHLRAVFENVNWKDGQPEKDHYDIRTRFIEMFSLLLEEKLLEKKDAELVRVRTAIANVHGIYAARAELVDGKSGALFAVLVAFELQNPKMTSFVVRWALENHVHLLRTLDARSLFQVVTTILESKKRTIFVSMPFGLATTDHHWAIINEVCNELNEEKKLAPALVAQRVDWFSDGTSYAIVDRIVEMIDECGLLIGNLTYARNNVYHEIGFVMGRNRAVKRKDNLLLILETNDAIGLSDKAVGFNLQGVKQLRFKERQELKPALKKELRAFFNLN